MSKCSDGGGDDAEQVDGELDGIGGERLGLEKEDEVVRKIKDPKLPSGEEVERHYLMGHMQYRDWCPVCVRSQGREIDHTRDKGKGRDLPEYSWDYCFPGDELGFKWTVLVGRERVAKSWMAVAVSMKGVGTGRFVVDTRLDFIGENGGGEWVIIVKTDQEPAIECLIKDLVDARGVGTTMVEESPVKSSGSNGIVERAVQEVEGKMRAIFLSVEERLGGS